MYLERNAISLGHISIKVTVKGSFLLLKNKFLVHIQQDIQISSYIVQKHRWVIDQISEF